MIFNNVVDEDAVPPVPKATYRKLEKALTPPVVDNNTTAHHAGFLLGIQYTLKKLRELTQD